jgi:hypothetical protein
VGRRANVDPKPTVDISPFNCFKSNPIGLIDILGDTTINGQKFEGANSASATTLGEVVLNAKYKRPSVPLSKIQSSIPLAEINEVINERAKAKLASYEKINAEDLTYTKTNKGWKIKFSQRKINMITSGATNAADEVTAILTESMTSKLKSGFQYLEFVDVINFAVTLNSGGGISDGDLPFPIIGGVTSMLVNNYVNEFDYDLVQSSLSEGYAGAYYLLTNSMAGRRSGLQYIWTSKDAMSSIIENGMINFSKLKQGSDYIVSSPHPYPTNYKNEAFPFFLVFHKNDKSKKSNGTVKNFGVYPVTKK